MQSFDHSPATWARPARRTLAVAAFATFAFAAGVQSPAAAQGYEEHQSAQVLDHSDAGIGARAHAVQAGDGPAVEKYGKKIEFYMPTSYSSVVEALMGKSVNIAVLAGIVRHRP